MVTSRGAALRITVESTNEGFNLTLAPWNGKSRLIRSRLNRESLVKKREFLHNHLDEFKRLISPVPMVDDPERLSAKDWGYISNAVNHLHEKGLLQALDLFNESLPDIVTIFQQSCPSWEMDLREMELPVPKVDVESLLEDIVPLEFLPLFNTQEPGRITNLKELQKALRSFVGFSTAINRIDTRSTHSAKKVLDNIPKLPIKLFHYAGLEGAKEEKRFFDSNGEWIELEGPWPDKVYDDPAIFLNSMTDQLVDPTLRFQGGNRMPPDQVLHFACHCDTTTEDSDEYTLTLATDDGPRHRLSIGKLRVKVFQANRSHGEFPLVMFNACGTSRMSSAGVASFPRLFLGSVRSCGFIGTETRIPDNFAAVFSNLFYTRLLHGDSLGKAVYSARWGVLERHCNPLGILYTVYADPDIRVSSPVQFS